MSKTLFHYWKTGQREPSPGFMRRLVELERDAGILPGAGVAIPYPPHQGRHGEIRDAPAEQPFSAEELAAMVRRQNLSQRPYLLRGF